MPNAQDAFDLQKRYRSWVSIENDAGFKVAGPNLIVYQGADILAALAAGNPLYRISHMYFEFENTAGVPSAGSAARTDTAASRQAVVAPKDLVRAPLIAAPLLSSSGVNYADNRATFHALTTATVGLMHGIAFTAGANSKIYAICLVAAPGGSDHLQDLIYARYIPVTAIPVTGTGQVSGSWLTEWN